MPTDFVQDAGKDGETIRKRVIEPEKSGYAWLYLLLLYLLICGIFAYSTYT